MSRFRKFERKIRHYLNRLSEIQFKEKLRNYVNRIGILSFYDKAPDEKAERKTGFHITCGRKS